MRPRQPPCDYRRLCPAENTLSAAQHRKIPRPRKKTETAAVRLAASLPGKKNTLSAAQHRKHRARRRKTETAAVRLSASLPGRKHFIRSTAPKKYRARRRKKVSAAHLHPNAGARALRSFVPGPGAETGQAEAPKCRIWQKGAPKRRFSSRFALTIGPKYDTLYP